MDTYFNGKVAVITGAGGMICSKVALDLASRGVKVALADLSEANLAKTADSIKAIGGTYMTCSCDVTDEASVEALAAKVYDTFGTCDFLINGAGGNSNAAMPSITHFDPIELEDEQPEGFKGFYNIDMKAFERVLHLNTMGTVIPIRVFSKRMAKSGGGSVINFASMNSYCPLTRCFAYAMSKAAVVNLTQSFAAYFAPAGIRINAVAPGFIANERSKTYLGTVEEGLTARGHQVINHTPARRFGESEDMCGTIRYLLDERAAAFVTGVTIPVDGGFLTLSGV